MGTQLLRRDGGRILPNLRDDLEQLFQDWFEGTTSTEMAAGAWCPRCDLEETDEAYVLHVELAGVDPDDIEVSLEDNTLTVKGERSFYAEKSEEGFTRRERSFGSFFRAMRLPTSVDADAIEAAHHNGVLTVTAPKTDKSHSRHVPITTV